MGLMDEAQLVDRAADRAAVDDEDGTYGDDEDGGDRGDAGAELATHPLHELDRDPAGEQAQRDRGDGQIARQ